MKPNEEKYILKIPFVTMTNGLSPTNTFFASRLVDIRGFSIEEVIIGNGNTQYFNIFYL